MHLAAQFLLDSSYQWTAASSIMRSHYNQGQGPSLALQGRAAVLGAAAGCRGRAPGQRPGLHGEDGDRGSQQGVPAS